MMPMPLFVMALRAANTARPADQPSPNPPKDRRSSIRLVWNAGRKPERQPMTPQLIHTKER
jgi:hypothetical protein